MINLTSKDEHRTALHFLVLSRHERAASMVAVLTTLGALPDVRDASGDTPLLCATRAGGQVEVVRALLHAGSDPNVLNNEGFSALQVAASSGQTQVVEVLMSGGADLQCPDAPVRMSPSLLNECIVIINIIVNSFLFAYG
jgi:hypothetical protein